jgi:opacity protein-like surface antigen
MELRINLKTQYCIKLVICLIAVSAVPVFGQDYFRQLGSPAETAQVLPSEVHEENTDLAQAPHVLLQPNTEDRYNLALGPLRFSASAGLGVMWTDNVGLSSQNRQSDFVISPSVNLDSKWRITEINTLHFSIGLGYSYYLQHSQYDTNGMTLSPNSELAFTIHVGDFAFTVRDQFSLLNDPISLVGLPANSGSGNFRRFQNQVGITTDWIANPVFDISLGYDHFNLWVLGSNLAGLNVSDQAIDTVSLTPRYKLGPAITLGLNMTASYVQYTGSNTNGQSYMLGPFVELGLTKNTHMTLGAGYQYFGNAGNSSGWDTSNSNSIYARASIDNRLNDFFSHKLVFSHSTEAGYTSNYYNLYDLEYAANWRATSSLAVDLRLIYQHYDIPGVGGSIGNRYGAEIGTRYQLTPSVSLGLSYRYINNTENIPNSNAYQNSVLFNVFYSF